MRKINTFLHVFKHSLLPLSTYYRKILTTPLRFSLKYFIVLVFVINCVGLLVFFVKNNDLLKELNYYKESSLKTLESFPDDLIIRVENGHLTTNYDQPYFIWFDNHGIPHLLAVVDPRATFEKINEYDATILITGEGIAIREGNYETRFYRFRPTDSWTIDKSKINEFKELFNQIYLMIPIILTIAIIVLIILIPVFAIGINITHLFLISIAVFFVSKFFLKEVRFAKVFQISLHSSTIPLLMEYLFLVFSLTITIPFGFTLLYLLFLTLSLYEVHTSKLLRK